MTARTDRIAALLSAATAGGKVPGVAVAAVFPDGEIVSFAAGIRDVASGAAMRPDSVVWIASMTIAITAANPVRARPLLPYRLAQRRRPATRERLRPR